MVDVARFYQVLLNAGVDFFTGVPDSLLKSFCAYVTDNACNKHVIAANEGGAVGLAAGHYLATGRPVLVYLQNSGLGNVVNPLVSLADPDVYSIPLVMLVGWRGEPGVHDEPQHLKQGKITLDLFKTLDIPAIILAADETTALAQTADMINQAVAESRPVALVVRKGLFAEYKLTSRKPDISLAKREDVIQAILCEMDPNAVIVSTTGMISREVYEIRERLSKKTPDGTGSCHSRDFLTVGSMGQAIMIAMGIAEAQPQCKVVCLDGDGASIMQMGNMAIAGQSGCSNLTHVVLNNAAHDSVGGQPTVGGDVDLTAIAFACGYNHPGAPVFREIKVAKGARADLGRPKERPVENKTLFMETLRK